MVRNTFANDSLAIPKENAFEDAVLEKLDLIP
jgi:hypothetical protein